MQFSLQNKVVVTESGKVLGEVRDADVVWPDMRVVQLSVRRSLLGGWLLVGVDSIVKVDGDWIVVREALVGSKVEEKERVSARAPSTASAVATSVSEPSTTRE